MFEVIKFNNEKLRQTDFVKTLEIFFVNVQVTDQNWHPLASLHYK